MNVSEIETAPATSAEKLAQADRRRPGRPARISPELLPLLRGAVSPDLEAAAGPQFGDPDQLRGMRGVAVGIAASSVLWAGIIYAARLILS